MAGLTRRDTDGSRTVIERFAPIGGRVLGYLTLAIGVLILVDIVVEWRTLSGLSTAGIVVAVCALVWLSLCRPAVVAFERELVLRNILSDIRIPWHLVESVQVSPVLTLPVGDRTYRSSAVGVTGADRRAMRKSRRNAVEAAMSGRPAGGETPGQPDASALSGLSPANYAIRRLEMLANKYADASRGTTEVVRQWRWPEFAVVGAGVVLAVVAKLAS